ncbi:BrnT family toxin [Sphingomonas bacterium]|uniref:BrnT family toxin n=1 Tax=Sphingomonas bacterium TaxID=1895847 RepID=UPI0015757574|nr:BrnT family toxin [Sphingomonas bacterium]
MEFVFDPAKDAANIAKHGVSLADFRGFDTEAKIRIDDRYDYVETRYRAWGRIGGRGFCVVFTFRETTTRVISFRRAHDKEMRRYE